MIGAKGKKILSLLLTIGILAGMLPAAAFAAGENKVSTQEQLQNMGEGSYVLTADITLDETWNPDQWGDLGFNGTLDGNGYTITLAGQPLFSAVRGTVRNLCLTGEVSGAAALTNTMASGTVENCLTDANVTNEGTFSNAYGLVGTLSAEKSAIASALSSWMFSRRKSSAASTSFGNKLSPIQRHISLGSVMPERRMARSICPLDAGR